MPETKSKHDLAIDSRLTAGKLDQKDPSFNKTPNQFIEDFMQFLLTFFPDIAETVAVSPSLKVILYEFIKDNSYYAVKYIQAGATSSRKSFTELVAHIDQARSKHPEVDFYELICAYNEYIKQEKAAFDKTTHADGSPIKYAGSHRDRAYEYDRLTDATVGQELKLTIRGIYNRIMNLKGLGGDPTHPENKRKQTGKRRYRF